MGTLGSEYRHYKLHNMYIFFLQSPFFLNLTTNLLNAYFKAKIRKVPVKMIYPRRGAVNGWIMISFCQEMACLAVYSGF